MTLFTGPVFAMAREQFHVIADHLEIPEGERDRLLLPKRAIAVSCPIHLDDGRTAVFPGYRVQHHLTLGPASNGCARRSSPGGCFPERGPRIRSVSEGSLFRSKRPLRHFDCLKAPVRFRRITSASRSSWPFSRPSLHLFGGPSGETWSVVRQFEIILPSMFRTDRGRAPYLPFLTFQG